MFDIIVSLCLAAGSPCAERLLPAGFPDQAVCQAAAPERAATWAASLKTVTVKATRCIAQADLATTLGALEVQQVAPGVFVHQGMIAVPSRANRGDTANLGFVIGDRSVAVIDAGGARAVAERFYAAIRAQTTLPISHVVLTHMHPDHTLGADFFRDLGAEIVGHPNLERALANRAESYQTALKRLLGEEVYLGTRLTQPDAATETREIDLGERVLAVTARPLAHTETDVTVLDRTTGTLFVGDLVFASHTPALDGAILGWQTLLDDMAAQTNAVARIVPGHGPTTLPWPEGMQATRAYLAAITAEARAAIADGAPMSQAVKTIGESQRNNWKLFDEFNRRNATAAFQQLEWE